MNESIINKKNKEWLIVITCNQDVFCFQKGFCKISHGVQQQPQHWII